MVPLLLTPGAGSDRDHGSLIAIEQRLGALSKPGPVPVHRMNFPYREAGKKLPDKGPVLLDAIVKHAEHMVGPDGPIILGGRSMGGRMCSMVAAERRLNVAALVLICYPLHPPGKPDRLRTDHFPQISSPCLFISGSRDAFGTPEELAHHAAMIPGSVTHHTIERSDHSLKGHDDLIADIVSSWVAAL
jgi:uncharacterized protein